MIKKEQNNHDQIASWKKRKHIPEGERWHAKTQAIWEKRSYRFLQDYFTLGIISQRQGLLSCVILFIWN